MFTLEQLIDTMNKGITVVINKFYLEDRIELLKELMGCEDEDYNLSLAQIEAYDKELKTLTKVLDMYNKGKLKPHFYTVVDMKTGNNKIKVKQHNFANVQEPIIAEVLNYNAVATFNKAEDVIDFIIKNAQHFIRKGNQSLYFIRDNSIYFNIKITNNELNNYLVNPIFKIYAERNINPNIKYDYDPLLPF